MSHSQFHCTRSSPVAYTYTYMAKSLRRAYDYWQDQPDFSLSIYLFLHFYFLSSLHSLPALPHFGTIARSFSARRHFSPSLQVQSLPFALVPIAAHRVALRIHRSSASSPPFSFLPRARAFLSLRSLSNRCRPCSLQLERALRLSLASLLLQRRSAFVSTLLFSLFSCFRPTAKSSARPSLLSRRETIVASTQSLLWGKRNLSSFAERR